jgi:anti-anti-sigma factor
MSEEIWSYHVTRTGPMVTVELSGEIDMAVSGDVLDAITAELGRAGTVTVLVDLSAVTFLGSAGLQALVEARRLADAGRRRLVVTGAKGLPRQVLEITRLLTFLDQSESD